MGPSASVSYASQPLVGQVVASIPHQSPSVLELFVQANFVVKLVMIGLILASIWSWTIIVHKFYRLRSLNKSADSFEDVFWSGIALDDLYAKMQHTKNLDPMSSVFCSAMREWHRSLGKPGRLESSVSLEHRIARLMKVTIDREVEELERYTGFLASLASNGMIVGLFGTVLGIMNSFQAIATQQNTNLAVVAPGIAEALFATAIGLVAAIPASIAFNKIASDIGRYAGRLDAFSHEFAAIISRQLEEAA